jgi:hypothetical protein
MQESSNPVIDTGSTINFANAITTGPYGLVTSYTESHGGVFNLLGSAAPLIDAGNIAQPTFASIERNVLSSGSGRVAVTTDTTAFADPGVGGFFSTNETLFLNTVQWILPVPEPTAIVMAGMGAAALVIVCRRKGSCRMKRS